MGDGTLKLRSFEGDTFIVDPEVASMSPLIKNIVDDSSPDEEIPLPKVKTAILGKVLEYCKHHKDSPAEVIQKPLKSMDLGECGVSQWDTQFVNIEREVLFQLIVAATYLDIKCLVDLTCAKVASSIKGMGPDGIREYFRMPKGEDDGEEDDAGGAKDVTEELPVDAGAEEMPEE